MTIYYKDVYLNNYSVVGGPYLNEGPLKEYLDETYKDFYDGEKTFEDCEIKELYKSINILLNKVDKKKEDIDLILSSDLTNQLMISNYLVEKINIPYFGVYNACASLNEELIIASLFKNKNIICTTSAHTLTSERQYRSPIEYGSPKPDYSTFTVSASTACLVSNNKEGVRIESGTIGKVIDSGIKDSFDMGSAMAIAAVDTLHNHLVETNRGLDYYDLIISGDLGKYGEEIFKRYYYEKYKTKLNNYLDAGAYIYNKDDKRVYAGGSGPSCLPTYFYLKVFKKMKDKKIKRVLLLATGALLSTTSVNQKKTIPSICHAVSLEAI